MPHGRNSININVWGHQKISHCKKQIQGTMLQVFADRNHRANSKRKPSVITWRWMDSPSTGPGKEGCDRAGVCKCLFLRANCKRSVAFVWVFCFLFFKQSFQNVKTFLAQWLWPMTSVLGIWATNKIIPDPFPLLHYQCSFHL